MTFKSSENGELTRRLRLSGLGASFSRIPGWTSSLPATPSPLSEGRRAVNGAALPSPEVSSPAVQGSGLQGFPQGHVPHSAGFVLSEGPGGHEGYPGRAAWEQ